MLHDELKMYNFILNEIKNESRLQNFRRVLMPYIRSREDAIEVLIDKKYISRKRSIMLDFKNYYYNNITTGANKDQSINQSICKIKLRNVIIKL